MTREAQEEKNSLGEQKAAWLSRSGLMQERERELASRAFDILMGNRYPNEGYPWSPYRLFTPGWGKFRGVWNWDTAFHAMGVCRWDAALARENILGFLSFEKEDGLLPDVVEENGVIISSYSKPPVFAKATETVYRADPDTAFIKAAYPALVKNEAFWREKRCENGLFYYSCDPNGTDAYDPLTRTKYESGWDDSPRWDEGMDWYPIDLNCFMVDFYRSLAFLASELGYKEEAEEWKTREACLASHINNRMWSEENGYYADLHRRDGRLSDVLTPASFMPLFVKIATVERAERAAELAEKRFGKRMPTVAFDHPAYSKGYWRGPTWLNVAYFAAKGLKNYDLPVAEDIREWVLSTCDKEKRGIFENYDSVTGEGLYFPGFSWSCVFLIEFLLNWD